MSKEKAGRRRHIGIFLILLILIAFLIGGRMFDRRQSNSSVPVEKASYTTADSTIRSVKYSIRYKGRRYPKTAYVYVPKHNRGNRWNVFYLMHGSGGNGRELAETMQPLMDRWIRQGRMKPMLVVFPTYYPDRTYMQSDYSQDYPLNHFYAETESLKVVRAVETRWHTYAQGTSSRQLQASRTHRAFGGYSMGGVTTWDVLASQAEYFSYYMPMAGDSWLLQNTSAGRSEFAQAVTGDLRRNRYTSNDVKVIAMVGENDSTKYSMIPQIRALRKYAPDLITGKSLIYWENPGGGHSLESLEAEVRHGIPMLFR